MSENFAYKAPGSLTFTAPHALNHGQIYRVGSIVGRISGDAAEGELAVLEYAGSFVVDKAAAAGAMAVGDPAYLLITDGGTDPDTFEITDTDNSGANGWCAVVTQAAGASDTEIVVEFNGRLFDVAALYVDPE